MNPPSAASDAGTLIKMAHIARHTADGSSMYRRQRSAILDPSMCRSVIFDNGTKFAKHSVLKEALGLATFLCDACASWQKGGVANANGRIRRWLPRKTDLDEMIDEEIQ